MGKYRNNLPQFGDLLFLTDGGLETSLIFQEGLELPLFAAFDLLKDDAGTATLRDYYQRYAGLADQHEMGLVLESPTWRANAKWGAKLGYDASDLMQANRKAIDLMSDVRATFADLPTPIVISGNLGPRGDGYRPDSRMTVREAQRYHAAQIATFAATDVDMVSAFTTDYELSRGSGRYRARRAVP